MEQKILAIVPAFNEAQCIEHVIKTLQTKAPFVDIAVINDQSRDNTSHIAKSLGVVVLDLPIHLGIGGAVQTGFKYAARNGYTIVVQIDGDGQHDPAFIPQLIAPIQQGNAEMVIGSRFITNEGYRSTRIRRCGIWLFQQTNRLLTRQRISDNTSGFRAYSQGVIKLFAQRYPTDYPEPEAVVYLSKRKLRIKEIPVVMTERYGGLSSIPFRAGVYYMFKVIIATIIEFLRKSP